MTSINRHFRREGWVMLAVVFLPLLIALAISPFLSHWLDVDACLDAGGQRDAKGACIHRPATP